MPFPYSYSDKLILTLKPKFIDVSNLQVLSNIDYYFQSDKKTIDTYSDKKQTHYTSIAPIFNFKYSYYFNVNKSNDDITVHYTVNLEKLLTIILVAIILTAFFSFVSVKYFLILSAIFSFGLYSIFYLIINNSIQQKIKNSLTNIIIEENSYENISEEQRNWINDKNKCSACGNYLEDFDLHCTECGIKLNRNRYSIPLNTSRYNEKEINFHFKKK